MNSMHAQSPTPARASRLISRFVGLTVPVLLVAASGCSEETPEPPKAKVRNVILLIVDTLRADRLGCYGYDRKITPNIDALAARGTTYDNARPQGSNTRYSMLSMLTGLYVTGQEERLPEGFPTLAERVKESGKITSAFVGNATIVKGSRGFERGFDHMEDCSIDGETERITGDAFAMFNKFRMWYQGNQEEIKESEGFFTWFQVMDPHIPYIVTDEERAKLGGPLPGKMKLRETWSSAPKSALALVHPKNRKDHEEHMATMARENNLYDTELVGLDRAIGVLFKFLKNVEELDDTLIILASDHGEFLYDRLKYPEEMRHWIKKVNPARKTLQALFFNDHGWSFHEEQWKSPLILAGPDTPAGVRQSAMTAHVDIYPTVLEACGVRSLDYQTGHSLYGGKPGQHKEVYAYTHHISAVINEKGWKFVDRRPKLEAVYDPEDVDPETDGPAYELYNVNDDPKERDNLAEQYPERVDYFLALLDQWRTNHDRERVTTLTQEDLEALEQMGYLGTGASAR